MNEQIKKTNNDLKESNTAKLILLRFSYRLFLTNKYFYHKKKNNNYTRIGFYI
jgi:hypothetical protein